jgi:hypothetical protein
MLCSQARFYSRCADACRATNMVFWLDIADILALFLAVFPARVSILAIEPNRKK